MIEKIEEESVFDYYKFICVDGKVKYITAEQNKCKWDTSRRDFYDRDWNHLNIRLKYPNAKDIPDKPAKLSEMISVSEKLSAGLDFAVIHIRDTDQGIKIQDIRFQIGGGVEKWWNEK